MGRIPLIVLTVVAATVVLAGDAFMPLLRGGRAPYFALVILGWWYWERRHILVLAILATVLAILGQFFLMAGDTSGLELINRAIAIVAIWVIAYLLDRAKRSAEELELNREVQQESEERFRGAFENSTVGVAVLALDGSFETVNETFCDFLGYSEDELLNLNSINLTLKMQRQRVHQLKQILESGESVKRAEDRPYIKKDGSVVWAAASLSALKNANDEVVGVIFTTRDISEQVRAEEFAKIGHFRRSLVDDTQIWSPGMYALFDLDPRECVPDSDYIRELLGESGKVELRAFTDGEAREFDEEVEIECRDGKKIIRFKGTMGRDEKGKAISSYGSCEDITERKAAENLLRVSEDRYAHAFVGTSDGIWDWDIQAGHTYWSPKAYEILGYEPNKFEVGYEAVLKMIHPADVARVEEAMRDHLEDNIPFDMEYRYRCKDESYVWIHSRGQVFRDEAGKPLRMSGSFTDITERKKATNLLRKILSESELLHKTGLNINLADNVDQAIELVLRSVCEHTGWPVGHVYITSANSDQELLPSDVWYFDDSGRFEAFRKITRKTTFKIGKGLPGRILESGEPAWILDIEKDQNFPRAKLGIDLGLHSAFGFPVLSGKRVVAVLEFFTPENVERDQDLLKTLAQVGFMLGRALEREANRETTAALKASEAAGRTKTAFLANMSHELRTPLNAIIGFSEIQAGELLGPMGNARYLEYAKDITASAYHLLSLINDILDVSVIESGEVKLDEVGINVGAMLDSCLRLVRSKAEGAKLDLKLTLPDSHPILLADERRVKQVLVNLLSNAIKFTPEDGSVTLVARLDEDGCHEFTVTDTGIGIALEDIDKAMEPFEQVEASRALNREGTGLGLPLSRSLAELHTGTLKLTSEPGVGTTATLRFPKERTVRVLQELTG